MTINIIDLLFIDHRQVESTTITLHIPDDIASQLQTRADISRYISDLGYALHVNYDDFRATVNGVSYGWSDV
jgi:hypothetical protein